MTVTRILALSLLISISLNAGLVAYLVVSNSDQKVALKAPQAAPRFVAMPGSTSVQRVLPRPERDRYKGMMLERMEDIRQQSVLMNQNRTELVKVLRQPAINREELQSAFGKVQKSSVAMQAIAQKELIDLIMTLSPEVRDRMAKRLENMRMHRDRMLDDRRHRRQPPPSPDPNY